MRRGFGLLGLVLTTILIVIVGAIAYNVGWSDGVNTHLPAVSDGNMVPPYYYGYGPHFGGPGFGIFGFLWFLFVLFVIFALLRFAFLRRFWGGGWGRGGGMGRHGYGMPPGIEERMQDWHKRAHGEQPSTSSGSTAPPPPPPDTASV